MAVINGYTTLSDLKAYMTARGHDFATDPNDDRIIEDIIDDVCREIETRTDGKTFYPRVETRNYDVPYGRQLDLDDDLLEMITLTNGEDTVISSSG